MQAHKNLRKENLFAPFNFKNEDITKIGLEVEIAALNPRTGLSVPYRGKSSICAFFRLMLDNHGGKPVREHGNILGIEFRDGSKILLEHGGALEFASFPANNLGSLISQFDRTLHLMAETARECGFALVPGGYYPFDSMDTIQWVPKSRSRFQKEYFASLGPAGSGAIPVMVYNISTQVTFDYHSQEDLNRKLRASVLLTPIICSIFVNSPIENGKITGFLSKRMIYFFKVDPCRCGAIPVAVQKSFRLADFIEWALGIPMIYRLKDSEYIRAESHPFAKLLEEGFDDGAWPDESDWISHLSQIYTDIRLRDTLETRGPDGPSFDFIPSLAALWTGLLYHEPSCKAALQLVEDKTLQDYQAAQEEVARHGLKATYGGDAMASLAREILDLAKKGLMVRVASGLEPGNVLAYLDKAEEIVTSGETLAERCLKRWDRELQHSPQKYIAAYRIP